MGRHCVIVQRRKQAPEGTIHLLKVTRRGQKRDLNPGCPTAEHMLFPSPQAEEKLTKGTEKERQEKPAADQENVSSRSLRDWRRGVNEKVPPRVPSPRANTTSEVRSHKHMK